MKAFMEPEVEISVLSVNDVITASFGEDEEDTGGWG